MDIEDRKTEEPKAQLLWLVTYWDELGSIQREALCALVHTCVLWRVWRPWALALVALLAVAGAFDWRYAIPAALLLLAWLSPAPWLRLVGWAYHVRAAVQAR